MTRVIQVIETDLYLRGTGKTSDDPIRTVRQYYTIDGEFLAEVDEIQCTQNRMTCLRNKERVAKYELEQGR